VIICGQCGTSSEGAKFCPECGAALRVAERPVAEERKVVTALFCDLVGFTSLSETADPEDVSGLQLGIQLHVIAPPMPQIASIAQKVVHLVGISIADSKLFQRQIHK